MPPTDTELLSMELVFEGAPYIGQTNSNIDVNDFDWVFEGGPFVVSQAVGPDEINGDGASTLTAASQSLTAELLLTVSAVATLSIAQVSASGNLEISATSSSILGSTFQALEGSVDLAGSAASTLSVASQAVGGEIQLTALGASTISVPISNAIGDLYDGSNEAQGASVLSQASQSVVGQLIVSSVGASTISHATQTADGNTVITSIGTSTLAHATQASAGEISIVASISSLLPIAQQVAQGSVLLQGTGASVISPAQSHSTLQVVYPAGFFVNHIRIPAGTLSITVRKRGMMKKFSPKDPEDEIVLSFDFEEFLVSEETITSAEISLVPHVGADDPLPVLEGSVIVSGAKVGQRVVGGTAGQLCELRCEIETSAGLKKVVAAEFEVTYAELQ